MIRREAYLVIQQNIRSWCTLRTWPWFKLYAKVKPMLQGLKKNEEYEKLESRCKELEETLAQEAAARAQSDAKNAKLTAENQSLTSDLEREARQRKSLEGQVTVIPLSTNAIRIYEYTNNNEYGLY